MDIGFIRYLWSRVVEAKVETGADLHMSDSLFEGLTAPLSFFHRVLTKESTPCPIDVGR